MASIALVPAVASTLYDIEEHLDALAESIELVTPDQEQQFLADFQPALTSAADKRDCVAHRLARLENQQSFAAAEIRRLQGFKKGRESEQARLEGYVSYCIHALGKDAKDKYRKLEGNTTVMFLRGCAPSVDVKDEAAIPLDYKRAMVHMGAAMWDDVLNALDPEFRDAVLTATNKDLSVTVDKVAIKAAIEAGIEVHGARLITDKTTLGRK